jgi:hypothetical protein
MKARRFERDGTENLIRKQIVLSAVEGLKKYTFLAL